MYTGSKVQGRQKQRELHKIKTRRGGSDAAKETLTDQAGEQSLTHWGKKISDGYLRDGKRLQRSGNACLRRMESIVDQCPCQGKKQNLIKHLEGPVVKVQSTHGGHRGLLRHGLQILYT